MTIFGAYSNTLVTADHTSESLLVRMPNNDILHFFRSAAGVAGDHIANSGKIVYRRSTNEGQTWGTVITVFDDAYDNRNLGGGFIPELNRIVVFCRRYDVTTSAHIDQGFLYSDDFGATWSSYTLTPSVPKAILWTACKMIYVPTRGWMQGGYGYGFWDSSEVGEHVMFSADGITWGEITEVVGQPSAYNLELNEPWYAYVGSGKIIGLIRSEVSRGAIDGSAGYYQVISEDYGYTWQNLGKTNVPYPYWGSMPQLWYDEISDELWAIGCSRRSGTARYNDSMYFYRNKVSEVFNSPTAWTHIHTKQRPAPVNSWDFYGYPDVLRLLNDNVLVILTDAYYDGTNEDANFYQFEIDPEYQFPTRTKPTLTRTAGNIEQVSSITNLIATDTVEMYYRDINADTQSDTIKPDTLGQGIWLPMDDSLVQNGSDWTATEAVIDTMPDSVVGIVGVLRDGVWYWSVESDALDARWVNIGVVTVSKISETVQADCPVTSRLNSILGAEYRVGGGAWQEAPTPVLVSGTTYRITLNYSIAIDDVRVRFRVTDAGSNTYSSISTLVVVIPATTYRVGEPPLPPHWISSISAAVRTLIGEPLKQYVFSIATAVLTRVGVDCRSLVTKIETGNIHRSPVDASASIRWDNRLDEPFITQAVSLNSTDTGAQATTTATKDTTSTGIVGLTKQTGDGTSTGAKALTQSGAVKLTKLNTPTAPVKHVSVKKEAAALDETGTKQLNPQFKPD